MGVLIRRTENSSVMNRVNECPFFYRPGRGKGISRCSVRGAEDKRSHYDDRPTFNRTEKGKQAENIM